MLHIDSLLTSLTLNVDVQNVSSVYQGLEGNEIKLIKKHSDEWAIEDCFYDIRQHQRRGGIPPDKGELIRLFEQAKKLGLHDLIEKWSKVYPIPYDDKR